MLWHLINKITPCLFVNFLTIIIFHQPSLPTSTLEFPCWLSYWKLQISLLVILVIPRLSNCHISQTSLKQVTVSCSTICTIFSHILSLSSLTLHTAWALGLLRCLLRSYGTLHMSVIFCYYGLCLCDLRKTERKWKDTHYFSRLQIVCRERGNFCPNNAAQGVFWKMTQLCSDYELLFLSCQQIVYTSFILFYFLLQSFQINGNYLAVSLQKFISSLTLIYLSTIARQPPVGWGLFFVEDSRSHSDTPHSAILPWTSDQSDTETSTWQHTTLTGDKHSCPRRDSNPQSHQASGRRPSP